MQHPVDGIMACKIIVPIMSFLSYILQNRTLILCGMRRGHGPGACSRICQISVARKSPHCDPAPFPPKVTELFPIFPRLQQPHSANHAKFHQVTALMLVPLIPSSLPPPARRKRVTSNRGL
jgi:hypothetical protein